MAHSLPRSCRAGASGSPRPLGRRCPSCAGGSGSSQAYDSQNPIVARLRAPPPVPVTAVPEGHPGRRKARLPVDQRVCESGISRRPHHLGPAVVGPGYDDVDLVVRAPAPLTRGAMFGDEQVTCLGVPGQALGISVAVREYLRPAPAPYELSPSAGSLGNARVGDVPAAAVDPAGRKAGESRKAASHTSKDTPNRRACPPGGGVALGRETVTVRARMEAHSSRWALHRAAGVEARSRGSCRYRDFLHLAPERR